METSTEQPSGGQELKPSRISIKIPRKRRQSSSSSSSSISRSSSLLADQHVTLSNAEDEGHCDNNNNDETTPNNKRQKLLNEKNDAKYDCATAINADREIFVNTTINNEGDVNVNTGNIHSYTSDLMQTDEKASNQVDSATANASGCGDKDLPNDEVCIDKEVGGDSTIEDTCATATEISNSCNNNSNNDHNSNNSNAAASDYDKLWNDSWDKLNKSGKRDEEGRSLLNNHNQNEEGGAGPRNSEQYRANAQIVQIQGPLASEASLVCEPREFDVLCGRGGATTMHPGNVRFRQLIKWNKPTYRSCRLSEKAEISRSIVAAIRENQGRFLERDEQNGNWHDIGDEKAILKTSQAIRDTKNFGPSEYDATATATATWKASDGTSQAVWDHSSSGQMMIPHNSQKHFGDNSTWNGTHGASQARRDHATAGLIPNNPVFQHHFGNATGASVATMNGSSNLPAGSEANCNANFSARNPPTPPLQNYDVIFGYGDAACMHPGNETYQSLVDSFKEMYSACTRDDEKTKISSSIIKSIQEQGGRFIEMDVALGIWIDIGDAKAIEKTSQVLNEATMGRKNDCPISILDDGDDGRDGPRQSQADSLIERERERKAKCEFQEASKIIHRAKQYVLQIKARAAHEVEKARDAATHYKDIAMKAHRRKEEVKAQATQAVEHWKQELKRTRHECANQAKELETTKGDLETKQRQLDEVHQSWQDQSYEIDDLKSQIESLREEVATERNKREDTEQRYRTVADALSLQAAELVHEQRQGMRDLENMCSMKVEK